MCSPARSLVATPIDALANNHAHCPAPRREEPRPSLRIVRPDHRICLKPQRTGTLAGECVLSLRCRTVVRQRACGEAQLENPLAFHFSLFFFCFLLLLFETDLLALTLSGSIFGMLFEGSVSMQVNRFAVAGRGPLATASRALREDPRTK